MAKNKPLKIIFEDVADFQKRIKKQLNGAIKGQRVYIKPKDIIRFTSVTAYQKFMSDQKYSILAAISQHKPQSIYQLAKLLNRPQPNVIRDCDLLEGHGFISQEETGEARRTKVPKLAFNYNSILVCMPTLSYKVELMEAA